MTRRRIMRRCSPPLHFVVPLFVLIACSSSSKEFFSSGSNNHPFCRTCCHAFGFSRPSLPSWLARRTQQKSNMAVKTKTEPEVYMDVSVTDVLKGPTNGENQSNGQQPLNPSQSQVQSEIADGLPILPIGEKEGKSSSSSSSSSEILPSSPPLTFEKYMTMTSKRVPVEIRYNSQQSGLRPFFLTVAKKIKDGYPDVVVQKTDLATGGKHGGETPGDSMVFEVLVDGRAVVGKAETKRQSVSRSDGKSAGGNSGGGDDGTQPVDLANGISVYVSMGEIDQAITKARRKRRPSTTYSQQGEDMGSEGVSAIRLEVLRSRQQQQQEKNDHWD